MRGKILRDTNAGDGVIFVDGEQKGFTLEQHWKSAQPPKVGAVVDVELTSTGGVSTVTLVDETALAKEQAQKALAALGGISKTGANQLLANVSPLTLVAIVLLAVAWLFLSTFSVNVSRGVTEGATFYEVLKLLNNKTELAGLWSIRSAGAGVYGFLLWIVLALPLVPHFAKIRFAFLGYLAPLTYMLMVGVMVYIGIRSVVDETAKVGGFFGGRNGAAMAEKMATEMLSQTMNAISFGVGFYLAAATAIYLAIVGTMKLLAEQATSN